jgi:hypothetical protein
MASREDFYIVALEARMCDFRCHGAQMQREEAAVVERVMIICEHIVMRNSLARSWMLGA